MEELDKKDEELEKVQNEETESETVVDISVEEPVVSEKIEESVTPDDEVPNDGAIIEEREDTDEEESEEQDEESDYSNANLEELMSFAAGAMSFAPKEAVKRLQNIRPYLDDLLKQQRKEALNKFIEEGNDPESFELNEDINKERFYAFFHQAQEARKEERKRIEEEKKKNLARKQEILGELKELTEKDETIESINRVKELQAEWKNIKAVPQEHVQELWDTYRFLLEKFYDNHSINLELKDFDRKKNLEFKIDLIKKVDELKNETSIKRTFILLNKYHDEFKNTGPVPREFNEEIWNRFKAASDEVYAEKKGLLEELENQQKDNLKLKEVLVEKATLVGARSYDNVKQWNEKSNELNALFEEWKNIGPVPKSQNQTIWKAFREQFNEFYKNKGLFFEEKNKERKANLILKEQLCKRAEELMNSDDFGNSTKEILKLQQDWKEIGPVPDKVSNAVWKRFRNACDTFFNRKQAIFADKKQEEENNLAQRNKLIEDVNTLLNSEDKSAVTTALKDIHKQWITAGFVPFKKKNEVNAAYDKAVNDVYKKFDLSRESARTTQAAEHYGSMLDMPNGDARLKQEERKIREKINFLKNEIETWENNMEFFARSKNADKLKQEIQAKIDKSNGQIMRLEKDLKAIRSLGKEKANG